MGDGKLPRNVHFRYHPVVVPGVDEELFESIECYDWWCCDSMKPECQMGCNLDNLERSCNLSDQAQRSWLGRW